jgi:hypothetical protein
MFPSSRGAPDEQRRECERHHADDDGSGACA